MRSKIVEDMIRKVESTAEKDRVTRDEMILVVATIMKAMMGLKTKNGRLSTSVNTEFGARTRNRTKDTGIFKTRACWGTNNTYNS
ncbi:hypothetical protein [Enterobacter cloacae]|uniref:hypothetical protein n=1 Tax=Enterobacter cloacae TaxID=550 RepID=UPI00101B0500|nr:hypothetical protein [Enterobacter cloacae]QBC01268.1 hypothetical protein EWI30_03870 [Enterobacter cloacae]